MPIRLGRHSEVEVGGLYFDVTYILTKGVLPTEVEHGHPPDVEIDSVLLKVLDDHIDFTEFAKQIPAFGEHLRHRCLNKEMSDAGGN